MNTKKLISLLFIVIFLLHWCPVSASTFTDVPYSNKYSTAISYLESNNIIQGYSDGTFKPENTINRVEFLKIVLKGTRVSLDSDTPSGFSDIDENQWYSPYIRKAKSEGWIQGYPDNTFKPLNPVNKVEALKILGEIQDWDRLALGEVPEAPYKDTYRFSWYSPYVYFAKENGILFEETDYLYPSETVTRGYMSELVYRSIIKDVSTYSPQRTAEDIINSIPEVVTPADFAVINESYFDKIKLTESVPNYFYKNEVYFIEGDIIDGKTYDMIFAFLSENVNGEQKYRHYIGEITGSHFVIPVVFDKIGKFNLGIIPGENGESKIANITVLNGIPAQGANANSEIPTNLKIDYANDKTNVSFSGVQNNIFRIYFIQGDNVEWYFIRNKKTLDVFYKNFWEFNDGIVKWRVYGAKANSLKPVVIDNKWAKSIDSSFNAVTHNYKLSDDDAITTTNIPEELATIKTINVSGTTHENIFNEGAVITPDGTIDSFLINTTSQMLSYYGNDIIPANANFNFAYTPAKTGTYILEVNSQAGSAVVNTPVYVGNIIPIVPDFFDLQDPLETTPSLNLQSAREELLNYINAERAGQGLGSISLRSDLNLLAQNHSNDMLTRNFFSHINPDGESPDDRRKKLNITTDVGENLAFAPTIYFGHQALLRSAIHRENILQPQWDSIGIGIARDSDGYLYITEEFSHREWTDADLNNFENTIIDTLNSKRTKAFTTNTTLRDIARNWSNDMITKNFFSFTSPSGINLIDIVQNNGFTSEGRAYILMEGSLDSLTQQLLNESDILDSAWGRIGIGIKKDEWSSLYLTVLYTY